MKWRMGARGHECFNVNKNKSMVFIRVEVKQSGFGAEMLH